jgi:hypothetical protein
MSEVAIDSLGDHHISVAAGARRLPPFALSVGAKRRSRRACGRFDFARDARYAQRERYRNDLRGKRLMIPRPR